MMAVNESFENHWRRYPFVRLCPCREQKLALMAMAEGKTRSEIIRDAVRAFVADWDAGVITPDELNALRQRIGLNGVPKECLETVKQRQFLQKEGA